MKKIKTVVIGVGNMGQNHLHVFNQLKEVELVAVCDLDSKKGKKISSRYGVQYFKDYNELFKKNPNIELASVVVPTKYHSEIACFFIENGVNVLIEKPISDTIEAAKKIIEAAKKSGAKVTVGHVERFNPVVLKLKEIVDKGVLGKIISIVAKRVGVFPPNVSDANVLIDLAIHDIDVINYLLNEEPKIVYKHSVKLHTYNKEDTGEIFLVYNDAAAFIQVNWITPVKVRTMTVTGTKGYVELDYISQELIMYQAKIKKKIDGFSEFLQFSNPVKKTIPVRKEEPLLLEIKSFLDCIINGKTPEVTAESALKSLKICLQ